ncbi:hypothetical protein PYCCODRAFT_932114 [Trametes coccinea BRFM310]|uniref:Uncharacterized protein n=1 Tax=Trametes coccinea (strain BRFM310) TaxID=1353009 RepID=A0A1Y2IZ80_TRAC3|nr:hypothetical protein PYCCODRAFT_932114 [Trametes coccinea BRFM310]
MISLIFSSAFNSVGVASTPHGRTMGKYDTVGLCPWRLRRITGRHSGSPTINGHHRESHRHFNVALQAPGTRIIIPVFAELRQHDAHLDPLSKRLRRTVRYFSICSPWVCYDGGPTDPSHRCMIIQFKDPSTSVWVRLRDQA